MENADPVWLPLWLQDTMEAGHHEEGNVGTGAAGHIPRRDRGLGAGGR